jgi:DNA polymerase-3 subunit delta
MATRRAAGVYAVVGADSYLAERAVERLLREAIGDGPADDAVQRLRGEETTWARLLDLARTRSLFADRRALLVRAAEAIKGSDEGVAEYLADPTPGVTLILLAAKPDKRKGVWKKLLESAEVVAAEPLKGRALRGQVAEELRKRGLELDDEGLEELIERVGQDLRRLVGEIEKLRAFADEGTKLTASDVVAVLGRGIARPLYVLADALASRRRELALQLLDEALEEGEAPVYVLGALHRSLRQMKAVRGFRQTSWGEIASRLRVPPFKVKDLVEAGRLWSDAGLREAFVALGQADRQIKASADARVALAVAVGRACGEGRRASGAPRKPR